MTKKTYDFDAIIDRKGSNCVKHDRVGKDFGTEDVLPLWVADMDFATPDFVINAIRERCNHEVLGYPIVQEGWYTSIQKWLQKRYHWTVQKEEMGFVPGIVSGIAFTIQCFTQPGDNILIQTPVYPPFMFVPRHNDCKLLINELTLINGRFEIDFEDFEAKAADHCKMFILCSPHNPGGRIWTKQELSRMLEICEKHHVLVVTDEIHADLTLPGFKHFPAATLHPTAKIITLMAPSKTFNMAGLSSSFYVIQNKELRTKFIHFLNRAELSNGNIFAFVAPQAAYENGEDWLRQLSEYLQENVNYVDDFLKKNIPAIKACRPEASFLIWLDCRELGMDPKTLKNFFIYDARLALNPGPSFGQGGDGFMRLNIGCAREILREAMIRLKTAVDSLKS
ncbi:MAG TPA: PatB family C-S lyase [Bacteroidales bacterium]|nr:PatB family C-S lyase [Bacteroidales bacterium]